MAQAQRQSALEAHGEGAARLVELTWVLFIGGGLIFVAVMLIGLLALSGPPAVRSALSRHSWIVGGGIAFPVVVLSALLVYTFVAASNIVRAEQAPAVARIEILGELWWWRVKYLDERGNTVVETANEITVPAGQPVDLMLISHNVIHSLWVPNLAGKLDMIPGRVNRLRIQAHAPGTFRGQCAEYCGAQHAKMALYVVALNPGDFAGWLAAQAEPAPQPQEPLVQQGMQLFATSRCAICHTVRGTSFAGGLGPDLTHFGSRLSIAAGTLPNTRGAAAAWVTGSQHLKPGNRMPAYNSFSGEELRALSAYLESLR